MGMRTGMVVGGSEAGERGKGKCSNWHFMVAEETWSLTSFKLYTNPSCLILLPTAIFQVT